MTRLALAQVITAALVLGGCYYASEKQDLGDDCGSDPMDPGRFAADPATGVCFEFASSCDVPSEWPPCMPSNEACMVDADCGTNRGCVNGACMERGVTGCMADDNCPLTQHCDPAATTCLDNAGCTMDSECARGEFCDMVAVGDCDPNTPGCGMPMFVGLCSRQPENGVPGCTTNADCMTDQICPAQYGGCSSQDMLPPDGTLCPSNCEQVCYDDGGCVMGTRCNAMDVCGMPNPGGNGGGGVPLPCAGWCVPSM